MMQTVTVRVAISAIGGLPNPDRLARADRYVAMAQQSVDARQRNAFLNEAERIYREEGR